MGLSGDAGKAPPLTAARSGRNRDACVSTCPEKFVGSRAMATQWQGPHFIVSAAASALAFGGGYVMAGRSRPATSIPPPPRTNNRIGNEVAGPTGIPGFDTTPSRRRPARTA